MACWKMLSNAQGCQTWDFIPRSWEFFKVMGFFLGFCFFKYNLGINPGNYAHCSVKLVAKHSYFF